MTEPRPHITRYGPFPALYATVDSKRAAAGEQVRGVHGLASTYTGWGCRCPKCTEASRLESEYRRRIRGVQPPPVADTGHGTATRYRYGCRCPACSTAAVTYNQRWRKP